MNSIVFPETYLRGMTRLQKNFAIEAHASGLWTAVFRDSRGRVKELDAIQNLVTDLGLDEYLDAALKTGQASPTYYLGLTDGTPTPAAGDTMSSHAGWSEVTAYDEATREVWTPGTISSGSVDNSGAVATFTISSDSTTIGGAFLVDDNTKSGTSGLLFAVGAFTAGDKALDDNDTVDVTMTATQAAA